MGLTSLNRTSSGQATGAVAGTVALRSSLDANKTEPARGGIGQLAADAVTLAKFLSGPSPAAAIELPAVQPTTVPATRLSVPLQTQVGNACGTTSLSMVLTYFNAPQAVRQVSAIDAAIRPSSQDRYIDSFTAPLDIARYARRQGFHGTLQNDSSPADLARMIDQGVPPIILYDTAPNQDGSGLHYVVVSGYQDVGGQRQWTISDPNGYTHTKSTDDLVKAWSNLKVFGVPVPYNRLMITVAPKTGTVTLPSGATKPASSLSVPRTNTSKVVDWTGSITTTAIGVVATTRDNLQAARGLLQEGAAWLRQQQSQISQSINGRLGR